MKAETSPHFYLSITPFLSLVEWLFQQVTLVETVINMQLWDSGELMAPEVNGRAQRLCIDRGNLLRLISKRI